MHTNTKFKRRYDYGSDTDDWLITYTDTITLLLAFFVLILSTADIDQSKFEEKLQGIAETLLKREKAKLPLSEVKKKLDEVFKKYELEDEVEVMLDRKGITVEFASQSFYPSGSANILPTAVPVLEGIGEALSGISLSAYMIEVEDTQMMSQFRHHSTPATGSYRSTVPPISSNSCKLSGSTRNI